MADLHIRAISDTLLKRLKVGAAEKGLTLKAHVLELLEANGKAEDHRAPDVPGAEAVPVVKRSAGRSKRVSAPVEPCRHGAYPGFCKHEECRK